MGVGAGVAGGGGAAGITQSHILLLPHAPAISGGLRAAGRDSERDRDIAFHNTAMLDSPPPPSPY